ncbi:hypothetical protein OKW23_000552 [Bacilli bacterium PM5-9]|nr:hypothetical protein [Bacilli bacterium PM5-9]
MKFLKKIFLFALLFSFGMNVNATTIEKNDVDFDKKIESIEKKHLIDKNSDNNVSASYAGYTFYYENVTTGTPKATTNDVNKDRYYEKIEYDTIYRSYFVKVGDFWRHYKNYQSSPGYSTYTITFFNNPSNCKNAGSIIAFNCASMSVTEPTKARVNTVETKFDDNSRAVEIYGNNDFDQKIGYKVYDTKNRLTSSSVYTLNASGNIAKHTSESRTYHSNNKMKAQSVHYYIGNSTYNGDFYKEFNTRGLMTYHAVWNKNYKRTKTEERTYYSNNRIDRKRIETKTAKGVNNGVLYTKYRKTGKKQWYKRVYFRANGTAKKMNYFVYNKQGQTKSNKYGKAYKYVTYVKKNGYIISKVTKAQYNKKGKLGKAKKVKPTTATRTY